MTDSARRMAQVISHYQGHKPGKDIFWCELEGYYYVLSDTGRGWLIEEYQSEKACRRAFRQGSKIGTRN